MLILLSLSHRHSTVRERARFGLSETEQARLYRAIRRGCGGQVVFLNTCNRVEVVSWVEASYFGEALALINQIGARLFPETGTDFLSRAIPLVGETAAAHLIRVAGGLESQIAGDVQVLGQVRAAYLRASELGSAGAELHRLFQITLRAGKRIHRETEFGTRRSSAGRTAGQELLRWLAGDGFAGRPRVAVVGAGATGRAAATELAAAGASVVILNRSPERSRELAARHGVESAPFESRYEVVAAADGAIVATGSSRTIIEAEPLAEARSARARNQVALRLFDLSVPQNVDPRVATLPQVWLQGLDALPAGFSPNPEGAAAAASAIVADELARFLQWLGTRRPRLAAVA